MELWQRHNSICPGESLSEVEQPSLYTPVPTRLMSCFNASARLCMSLALPFFYVRQYPCLFPLVQQES